MRYITCNGVLIQLYHAIGAFNEVKDLSTSSASSLCACG